MRLPRPTFDREETVEQSLLAFGSATEGRYSVVVVVGNEAYRVKEHQPT